MIEITYDEEDFDYELRALLIGFFPGQSFLRPGEDRIKKEWLRVHFSFFKEKIGIHLQTETFNKREEVEVSGNGDFHKHVDKIAHPYRAYYKNELKRLLFKMLSEFPEEELPEGFTKQVPGWGTMTGVRPSKIPMRELIDGRTEAEVLQSLKEVYCCSEEKSRLCLEIAKKEASLIKSLPVENGYSLYIGIPFCPTTCLYCSFPSYPVSRFGHLSEAYLNALIQEMEGIRKQCLGHPLTSIYVGGGTPTALSGDALDRLFSSVKECFECADLCEWTVEAGRPDSITEEKLSIMKKHGIGRISINPQTMHDETLRLIGRQHTVEDTERAFFLARKSGFTNINMDLIAGLPGERMADFKDTLKRVFTLNPDSITVHSLVVKRASKLREVLENSASEETRIVDEEHKECMDSMEHMLDYACRKLPENGYFPYYMYRQKNSAGHAGSDGQENIGFAKPGKECLYNIMIMEELQTIVALGAGASTKKYRVKKNIVDNEVVKTPVVRRVENVKSIGDYIDRIDEMIERKKNIFIRGKNMRDSGKGRTNGGDI